MRKLFIVPVLAILAAVGVADTAVAGKPTIQRIAVDETIEDLELNAACGAAIPIHLVGSLIIRTFDRTTGPVEVRTLNQSVTFTAGDNTVHVRNVGADLVRIEPDGTATLMIVGQIPLEFNGVLKIDLETGEAIQEPKFKIGAVAELCAALAA